MQDKKRGDHGPKRGGFAGRGGRGGHHENGDHDHSDDEERKERKGSNFGKGGDRPHKEYKGDKPHKEFKGEKKQHKDQAKVPKPASKGPDVVVNKNVKEVEFKGWE